MKLQWVNEPEAKLTRKYDQVVTVKCDDQAVTVKKKFVVALAAYAVLGVLAWFTLSDEPIRLLNANIRLRTGTLLILGLFAFRSALYFWRTRIEEEQDAKPTE